MEFLKYVRDGKVAQPAQRKFTLEKWAKAFEQCGDTSAHGAALFKTREWVFQTLEHVRSELNKLPKWPNTAEGVRLLVGVANATGVAAEIGFGEPSTGLCE